MINYSDLVSEFGADNIMFVDHPEEMLLPWKTNSYFWQIVITYSVAFVVGITGNILSIIVMHCDHKLNNPTTTFLVSLSAANLLLLAISAPLETAQYFVNTWEGNPYVCKIAKYFEMLSAVASVLNLCGVSLERFIVIMFPLMCRLLCTMRNCRRAVLVVWIVSILLAIPVTLTKDARSYAYTNNKTIIIIHYCMDIEGENALAFSIYQFVLLFAFPAVLLIICYSFVIRTLWRSQKVMKSMTNE